MFGIELTLPPKRIPLTIPFPTLLTDSIDRFEGSRDSVGHTWVLVGSVGGERPVSCTVHPITAAC